VRQKSEEGRKGLLSFEVGIPEGQSLEVQQRSAVEKMVVQQKFGELQRGRVLVMVLRMVKGH